MLKKALPYIVAFGLLLITLVFFNIGYKTLTGYSDLTNRHNTVLNCFQNISKQINNAAILNPDLANAGIKANKKELFYADSLIIFQQIDLLRTTVRDSVNNRITAQLNTLIRSQVAWLFKSNVPDSIIQDKAREHIAAFERINLLIDQGITRTTILIEYRKAQLNSEIKIVRLFLISFILLSGLLLLITAVKFFKQQEKTKKKAKELEMATHPLSLTISPLKNAEEKTVGAAAICRDITGQKMAERQLASSIPGSIICLLDLDYRYLLIEGDMLEKIGYSKDNILGKKAEDVLAPETFAALRNDFKRVLEGETVTRESDRNGYYTISKYLPLKDENGQVTIIMTVGIDVTELKNAQRNITELNQNL